jgi:hypothetical protein
MERRRKMISRSESLKEFAPAMALVQREMPVIGFNAVNPYFKNKFTNFMELVRVAKPILAKHGFSVSQDESFTDDGQMYLRTVVLHSSDQWIASNVLLRFKETEIHDSQTYGKKLTFHKRYSYTAILNLVTAEDPDDDDGEAIRQKNEEPRHQVAQAVDQYRITKDQLEQLEYELKGHADIEKTVLTGMGKKSLKELPKEDYTAIFKRVRELIAVKENR